MWKCFLYLLKFIIILYIDLFRFFHDAFNLLNFNFKNLKYNIYIFNKKKRRNQEDILKFFKLEISHFFFKEVQKWNIYDDWWKYTRKVFIISIRRDKRREFFHEMSKKKKKIYPEREKEKKKEKLFIMIKILTCLSGEENINIIIIV